MKTKVWAFSALFTLIIGLGCKPIVRQQEQVSDVHAVSDGKLKLGIVGIEKDDAEAYRLLICQNQSSYSLEVLQDDSRCRVALLTENDEEVIFLPDQFRRGFMTKYKGTLKGLTVGALVILPVAAVGAFSGAWVLVKKSKKLAKEGESADDYFVRRVLEDDKFGKKFYPYYERIAQRVIKPPTLTNIDTAQVDEAIKKYLKTSELALTIQEGTATLSAINKWKKFVDELENQPLQAVMDAGHKLGDEIKKLDQEIERMGGVPKTKPSADGILSSNATLQDKQTALQAMGMYYKQENAILSRAVERNLLTEVRDKLISPQGWGNIAVDMTDTSGAIKKELSKLKITGDLAGLEAVKQVGIGAAAGATSAAGALAVLQKSIWGYHERMVGKYWNQIFVSDDDLTQTKKIKNMHGLLDALAKYFGYKVNPRALELQ